VARITNATGQALGIHLDLHRGITLDVLNDLHGRSFDHARSYEVQPGETVDVPDEFAERARRSACWRAED
jgi:hypothetical protein